MISAAVGNFEDWRTTARALLGRNVSPDQVLWSSTRDTQNAMLFEPSAPETGGPPLRVSKRFIQLARCVSCYRDSKRWALLYRLLFRITHGERALLEIETDNDTRMAVLMEKAVKHDIHHMHAFVRFKKVESPEGDTYVAWYQPDHYILELAVPFFVQRFSEMKWAILTSDGSAYWNRQELRLGPPAAKSEAPAEDALEDLWRGYYSAVFNPARVNPDLLRAKLPVRHWQTLPEAVVISNLVADAGRRMEEMVRKEATSAAEFLPQKTNLREMRAAVQGCRGCDLYKHATQAVFGRGPQNARVLLVGEQPGDQEDLSGEPFVGPAGQLLDRALQEAGIPRDELYITNAVKHFKFEERGKRRIHKTPRGPEISACRPWLEAEIGRVRPNLIVCLGATAAQSLYGRAVSVTRMRGEFEPHHRSDLITVTLHPSALLRFPDPEQKKREYGVYVEDFIRIRDCVNERWGGFTRAA